MVDRTAELHSALQKFICHVDELSTEDDPSGNGFHREYRELRELAIKNRDIYPATHGKLPYNIKKNRYKDIVPFDSTRVTLTEKPGVQGSDYINANYILDAHQREGYIASQGPLPQTLVDFWRMIHEQKVKVVMMACREVEAGKKKCAQYWVEEGAENGQFGEYEVACVDTDSLADDCDERHLQLIHSNETQDVFQYHYTGWPDHGIPDDIDVILSMIKRMRDIRMKDPDHAPVVVHCSAGCGRTGTICAIDYAWELLKSGQLTEDFNLFEIAKTMREQRQSMIQTPEQYQMAHLAVKELFQKHIEIMNESVYANVELQKEDGYSSSENKTDEDDDYTDVQNDALDTVGKYMKKEETAPIIPEREQTVKQPEKEETVRKIVENNHVEPKIKKEQTEHKGYENISRQNYENALLIGKTDDTEQNQTIAQRRLSYEKNQLSYTDSGPIFVPTQSVSITKGKTSPPLSPTNPFYSTVPETKIETQAPLSGPRFIQYSVAQQGGQTHSSTQPSGPRFSQSIQSSNQKGGSTASTLQTSLSQEREKDQSTKKGSETSTLQTSLSQEREKDQLTKKDSEPSTLQASLFQEREKDQSIKKDSESQPKFKSVINIGGRNPSITQGNKAGGTQGLANRPHNLPNSDDYEMAFPIDDCNGKSLNAVTINSNSSSAIYAVPGKMKETPPENPSNVEVHNVKQVKAVSPPSPYETISSVTEPKKSAPKGRAYEEITLKSDGLYTTVADTADKNDAPVLPKREYLEPEQSDHKTSTSVADKLKSKLSNSLFSPSTKGSSSSDSAENKSNTVPGFNQRIEKKVKGPRSMPWKKKSKH